MLSISVEGDYYISYGGFEPDLQRLQDTCVFLIPDHSGAGFGDLDPGVIGASVIYDNDFFNVS